MSRPLAVLLICWLVWIPASCLADEPVSTGDTPDWELSLNHWRQRVEDARQRTEAFIADARSRQTESSAPVTDDVVSAIDQRIMNDDNLQPGDIVATGRGLLVFTGRVDSPRTPEDFQPVPETVQPAGTARR